MSIQTVITKLKRSSSISFTRSAALIGIILAVAGPFLMLTIGGRDANNLPWYIWVIIPMLLISVIALGFLMFRRESNEAQDISISPKRR
jgi:hypothetical protein